MKTTVKVEDKIIYFKSHDYPAFPCTQEQYMKLMHNSSGLSLLQERFFKKSEEITSIMPA